MLWLQSKRIFDPSRRILYSFSPSCANVGMGRTNLPASLLCAHIANSSTKRDVRGVHNAADIPRGKIWLPYGNGSLCQTVTAWCMHVTTVRVSSIHTYQTMAHPLAFYDARVRTTREHDTAKLDTAKHWPHGLHEEVRVVPTHPYHWTSRALVYSHGDAITTTRRGYRRDLSAPSPSPGRCVWASRAVRSPQVSATEHRIRLKGERTG